MSNDLEFDHAAFIRSGDWKCNCAGSKRSGYRRELGTTGLRERSRSLPARCQPPRQDGSTPQPAEGLQLLITELPWAPAASVAAGGQRAHLPGCHQPPWPSHTVPPAGTFVPSAGLNIAQSACPSVSPGTAWLLAAAPGATAAPLVPVLGLPRAALGAGQDGARRAIAAVINGALAGADSSPCPPWPGAAASSAPDKLFQPPRAAGAVPLAGSQCQAGHSSRDHSLHRRGSPRSCGEEGSGPFWRCWQRQLGLLS